MSDIETRIKEIIEEQLGPIQWDLNTSLDNLGIDSLDKIEIIMEIEEEFDVMIEDDDDFQTLGDLVAFIEQ
jgi:acyl carrier protein